VLAVAHRRGVVHRDLTPDNIMMTPGGLKIIDFGLATTVDPDAQRAARPPVLSRVRRPTIPRNPVSSASQPADDVYALGVLLYQMLTGRSPYPSAAPNMYLAAGRFRTVAPTPVLTVPGLPPAVADICRACMAKRPAERPASGDVALALWAMLPAVPPPVSRVAPPRFTPPPFTPAQSVPLPAAPLSPVPLPAMPLSPAPAPPARAVTAPVSPVSAVPVPVSPVGPAPREPARPGLLPSAERGRYTVAPGGYPGPASPFREMSTPGTSVMPRTGVMEA
jgi:serine/threonine protein kinase